MKNSFLTVTDLFCGAGGSSQGVRRASIKQGGGLELKLAMNHWKIAIQTHNTNFPDAIHDCCDISVANPRRYPSTDIFIGSPECTNHSIAKSGIRIKAQKDLFTTPEEEAERSRATMWDVPRFAEYHRYNILIVENVVDVRRWELYPSWLNAMDILGYNYTEVFANSMFFHPTPQSRDRLFIVFHKKGNKRPELHHMPKAFCHKCNKDISSIQTWKNQSFGKYKTQYYYSCPICKMKVIPYYYTSFNCIDWSDKGKRIGDKKRSLAPNSIKRIEYGLKKYKNNPFYIANYNPGYSKSMDEPFGTVTTQDHHSLIMPFIVNGQHASGVECRVRGVEEPMSVVATNQRMSLVMPFITLSEHTKTEPMTRSVLEPFQTQATRQTHGVVFPPFIVNNFGTSNTSAITDPLGTQMAVSKQGIVTNEAWHSFLSYYYGTDQATHITEPIGTVTTKDRFVLVNYKDPKIEDCYYRMLKPPEIKLAMAFDKDYVVCGDTKQQTKQLGNAVTPPVMEWLIEQCVKSLS